MQQVLGDRVELEFLDQHPLRALAGTVSVISVLTPEAECRIRIISFGLDRDGSGAISSPAFWAP